MLATRPKSITVIAVLLVVLALLSTISALTSSTAFTGARPPGVAGGNFQGNGNAPGGGNPPGGFNNRTSPGAVGMINPQILGYTSTGLTILGVILALLSAWGIWKQKRWALNLAIVLAIFFLLGSLPGLFSLGGRNLNWLRATLSILTTLALTPILVMGILPSVRDSVS
jgi:hypothetical protein